MAWSVNFDEAADDDLESLDGQVKERVLQKIDWLADNFDQITPIPLRGEFEDFYRLRVGDWRVFYRIDWKGKVLHISYIKHRSESYR